MSSLKVCLPAGEADTQLSPLRPKISWGFERRPKQITWEFNWFRTKQAYRVPQQHGNQASRRAVPKKADFGFKSKIGYNNHSPKASDQCAKCSRSTRKDTQEKDPQHNPP